MAGAGSVRVGLAGYARLASVAPVLTATVGIWGPLTRRTGYRRPLSILVKRRSRGGVAARIQRSIARRAPLAIAQVAAFRRSDSVAPCKEERPSVAVYEGSARPPARTPAVPASPVAFRLAGDAPTTYSLAGRRDPGRAGLGSGPFVTVARARTVVANSTRGKVNHTRPRTGLPENRSGRAGRGDKGS